MLKLQEKTRRGGGISGFVFYAKPLTLLIILHLLDLLFTAFPVPQSCYGFL